MLIGRILLVDPTPILASLPFRFIDRSIHCRRASRREFHNLLKCREVMMLHIGYYLGIENELLTLLPLIK